MNRARRGARIRPWISSLAAAACAVLLATAAVRSSAQSAKNKPAAAPAAKSGTKSKGKSTAKGGAAKADSNQVLVRIGNEVITRADVQKRIDGLPEQFRGNYGTPEGRKQMLDRMVEEKVWLTLAVKEGVDQRPAVKQQIEQQRRDMLVRTYLNDVMVRTPTASDSDARAYYDAHLQDYRVPATVTLRHIQTKKESDAKKVLQWAKAPNAKWDDLVKKFSTDTLTRASGGSLGTVTKEGQFSTLGAQPALAETALKLPNGAVAGPFKTSLGYSVIKIDAVKAESFRGFDQMKQVILRQLNTQHSQDFYKSQLDSARRSLGVKPDSTAIKGFLTARKSAREQFNEAQALSNPEARLEAYQKLLSDYPDSEVSPQAQFMIGFINSEELKNYDEAEKAFRELLRRWPKAELAASAEWMIAHMRSEDAPAFINLDSDSASRTGATAAPATKSASNKKNAAPGKP